MIKIERIPFWSLRPSIQRIGMGFIVFLPTVRIQVGHNCPPCRECGDRQYVICWPPENPGATICPNCCPHEDYEYERGERDYFCVECGDRPPVDWHGYDVLD